MSETERKTGKGNLMTIFKNLKNLTEKKNPPSRNSEKNRFSLYNVNVTNEFQKFIDNQEIKEEKEKRNSLEITKSSRNSKKPDSLPDSPRDFDQFQIDSIRTIKKHSLPSPYTCQDFLDERSGSISSQENGKLTPVDESTLSKASFDDNSKGSLEDGSLKKGSLEELAILKKNSIEEPTILKKNSSFDQRILDDVKEEEIKKRKIMSTLKKRPKKIEIDLTEMTTIEILLHCCTVGDSIHLKQLFNENTENLKLINTAYKGQFPLLVAASHNHSEIIEILLDHGANVDQMDSSERTSLHLAVSNGNKESTITLLGRGATVNKRDQYGYSPFLLAIKQHYFTICNDLLLFGADINFKRSDGTTVLHEIMLNNDLESLEYFVSLTNLKILVNQKDSQGEPPLFKGILRNKIEIVRYFIKHFKPKMGMTNDLAQNIFHVGAKSGVIEVLFYIGSYELETSVKNELINATDETKKKMKPIHYIVNSGNYSNLEKFLELGPDLNVKDFEGNTPLSLAQKRGDDQMYKLLKKNGAKLEKKK